jgi:xylan 1,4-beta-xylosidase
MVVNNQLENAIYLENLGQVKAILERNPKAIHEVDEQGIAMAFHAAKGGNLSIVRYIVENSMASMNLVDKDQRNMLHYATMSGSLAVVRYLVERVGLSPLSGDCNLVTPYDMARDNRFMDIEAYYAQVVGVAYKDLYRNPIRTGFYPDPSIVRVGEDYYMVNSSFIYFPCIPISHSRDLVHWEIIGHAITNPDWAQLDGLEGGRGYWAPDISYYDGKFYIAATLRLNDTGNVYRKQIVVSSERPEGPYCKPSIINEDGIDPSIFNDDDGRRYMLLNRGARIFELSADATRQVGAATMLYYGSNRRNPEGPHLLKKDGYYYLFQAEGGTGMGHCITGSRSRELMGVYEPCPFNPIMRQNNPEAGIQRCGHGKPVQTQNGQWYMVYLCGRPVGGKLSILGRETALDPITWTADGWPMVNGLKGPSVLQVKPDLPECVYEPKDKDDFTRSYLDYQWMFPRIPENDGIVLSGSHIRIKGSVEDLNSINSRNVVLRRQEHLRFEAECKMKLNPMAFGQDAGMTCYYDENTYLKFGVFMEASVQDDESRIRVPAYVMRINVLQHIDDEDIACDGVLVDGKQRSIYLKVVTNYLRRAFYYSYDGNQWEHFVTLDNVNYLCDEGIKKGKRFTGAMVGMYGHGGRDYILNAEFDYFSYVPR